MSEQPESKINRREFLKLINRGLVATGLTALAVPVVGYFYPANLEEMPSEPVLVCPVAELGANQSKTVRFGRYPALVIHTAQGLRAYSAVCTHFACIVKWDPDQGKIVCPCHEGYFDPLDGSVLSGPPPTPLTPIAIQIVDNQIYIGGEG
ncbi:MAG: Rieske (2Fe-2S) protein [Chloroflexota bacterium]